MTDELEYWKQRCLLAEDFINKHPADLDITSKQLEAYTKWLDFKEILQKIENGEK